MAITFVKEVGTADGAANTTISVTVPAAGVAQGDTLICAVFSDVEESAGWTAADTQGNTYTLRSSGISTGGNSHSAYLLTAYMTTALVSGNTITFDNHVGFRNVGITVCQFSGVDSAGYDTSRADWNNAGFGTAWSTGTITTAADNELLFGYEHSNAGNSNTAGGSYTEIADRIPTSNGQNYAVQYKIAGVAGSYDATGTIASGTILLAGVLAMKGGAAASSVMLPMGMLGLGRV